MLSLPSKLQKKNVTVNVFYGRFRVIWDEVQTILIWGNYIAILGNGKRLILSLSFAGKNKQKMLQFLHQQCERRNINFDKVNEPFPITHQNARVWL